MWSKYGFEILLITCVIFILLFGLYRKVTGKRGTWSDKYYYDGKKYTRTRLFNKPKESSGEIETKRVLEKMFNKPFEKIRPDFLNNPVTGGIHNLEIDCYNDELKLGVEYNGVQHYKYTPFFHRNKDAFHNQKYRDELKRRMCKDNGIMLIEVPYTVKNEDIDKFLRQELYNVRLI